VRFDSLYWIHPKCRLMVRLRNTVQSILGHEFRRLIYQRQDQTIFKHFSPSFQIRQIGKDVHKLKKKRMSPGKPNIVKSRPSSMLTYDECVGLPESPIDAARICIYPPEFDTKLSNVLKVMNYWLYQMFWNEWMTDWLILSNVLKVMNDWFYQMFWRLNDWFYQMFWR